MLRRCYLLGISQLKQYGKEIEIGGRHLLKIDFSFKPHKALYGRMFQGSFLPSMFCQCFVGRLCYYDLAVILSKNFRYHL